MLSSTQTTCERVFPEHKDVKTKLESTLHQDHLTPLILMSIEKVISIDVQKRIEAIANSNSNSSDQLKKILT